MAIIPNSGLRRIALLLTLGGTMYIPADHARADSDAIAQLNGSLEETRETRDLAVARLAAARARHSEQQVTIDALNALIDARTAEIERRIGKGEDSGVQAPDPQSDAKFKTNQLVSRVTPYVVVIEGDQGSGTGFLCMSDGHVWVYTAAHVLSGNSTITVRDHQGRTYQEFEFLECSEEVDLVRLKPKNQELLGLELAAPSEAPKVGDMIVAVGNSLGAGSLSGEAGRVTGIEEEMWEVDAEIIPGNSGGPVLDMESGKVIGIVTHLIISRPKREEAVSEETRVKRFAARLDKTREWRRMPVSRFVNEWKYIDTMHKETCIAWASAYTISIHFRKRNEGIEIPPVPGAIISANRQHIHVQRMNDWLREFERSTVSNRPQTFTRGDAIIKQILEDIRLKGNEPKAEDFSWYHRQAYEPEREWRVRLTE